MLPNGASICKDTLRPRHSDEIVKTMQSGNLRFYRADLRFIKFLFLIHAGGGGGEAAGTKADLMSASPCIVGTIIFRSYCALPVKFIDVEFFRSRKTQDPVFFIPELRYNQRILLRDLFIPAKTSVQDFRNPRSHCKRVILLVFAYYWRTLHPHRRVNQ